MLLVTPIATPCLEIQHRRISVLCVVILFSGFGGGGGSPSAELEHGKTCRGAFKDMSHLLILSSGKTETTIKLITRDKLCVIVCV